MSLEITTMVSEGGEVFTEFLAFNHKLNPKRSQSRTAHWFRTHNLLLDGERPETLLTTVEGRATLRALLEEMKGET